MNIAIKTEIDSRVILYPLLRALFPHGSTCVISSNPQLDRLIVDDEDGGFRDIRIILDQYGDLDKTMESYGIVEDDFDFIIYDNVGVINYDTIIIGLGAMQSEGFQQDVEFLNESGEAKLIQFGNKKKQAKVKPDKKQKKEKEDTEYDPAAKFRTEEVKRRQISEMEMFTCPWPSYADIESVEAEHIFPVYPSNIASILYRILGDRLNVAERDFIKYMNTKDTGEVTWKNKEPKI